jgi:hypothetical protein
MTGMMDFSTTKKAAMLHWSRPLEHSCVGFHWHHYNIVAL